MLLRFAILVAVSAAIFVASGANAQTPSPTATPTPGPGATATPPPGPPTPEPAIRHVVQVIRTTNTPGLVPPPLPPGATLVLRRLLNPDEAARGVNASLAPCAEVPIVDGRAEFVPVLTETCPDGAHILPGVRFPDAINGAIFPANGPIEWRKPKQGESSITVEVRLLDPAIKWRTARPAADGEAVYTRRLHPTAGPRTVHRRLRSEGNDDPTAGHGQRGPALGISIPR